MCDPIADFAAGHMPGSLSIELRPVFASWLGWLVEPDRQLVFVLADDQDRAELVRQCLTVGYEQLAGEIDGGIDAWRTAGCPVSDRRPRRSRRRSPAQFSTSANDNEYETGHLPGAVHVELGTLRRRVDVMPKGRSTVMCGHGERAMTGASILEQRGAHAVAVLAGGPERLVDHNRQRPQDWRVSDPATAAPIRLGLRENLGQFALLVGVNALVGGMIGQERTVLPLLADRVLRPHCLHRHADVHPRLRRVKAATNFFAGTLSDAYGRKPVLVAGWLVGPPHPVHADVGTQHGAGSSSPTCSSA